MIIFCSCLARADLGEMALIEEDDKALDIVDEESLEILDIFARRVNSS